MHPYGRVLGVNWVYFLWAIGYESVWIVVLPDPAHGADLSLLVATNPGSESGASSSPHSSLRSRHFIAWYSWTQVVLAQVFSGVSVQAFPCPLGCRCGGHDRRLGRRRLRPTNDPRRRVHETNRSRRRELWPVGLTAFALALPWFGLGLSSPTARFRALPVAIPLAGGIAVAGCRVCPDRPLVPRIASVAAIPPGSPSSSARSIASMLAGFLVFILGGALAIDVAGKLIFNTIAVLLLVRLARRFQSTSANLSPESAEFPVNGEGLR